MTSGADRMIGVGNGNDQISVGANSIVTLGTGHDTVTFGLQDYEGDDHFAMYSPRTLSNVLRDAGFTDVEVVTPDRLNGMAVEMELVARPAPPR